MSNPVHPLFRSGSSYPSTENKSQRILSLSYLTDAGSSPSLAKIESGDAFERNRVLLLKICSIRQVPLSVIVSVGKTAITVMLTHVFVIDLSSTGDRPAGAEDQKRSRCDICLCLPQDRT